MTNPPRVRLSGYELRQSDCAARLPFRFGAVTMTRAPLLCARAEVAIEGRSQGAIGFSSDLLVPRWFDKDQGKTIEQNQRDLIAAARVAGDAATRLRPCTVNECVEAMIAAVYAGTKPLAPERLRLGFGAALLERALLDAVARAHDLSFFAALRANLFALDPHIVAALPDQPLSHIDVRHTIGMTDALWSRDVPAQARVDDLPYALEDDVRAHGLRYFKIKIGGDRHVDHARLLRIHSVLAATAADDWRCSLDANEQYTDLDQLEALLTDLRASPAGCDLLARVLHVEQPLPRQATFDPGTKSAVTRLARVVPLLIDEADVDAGAFTAAHALGYTGVSMKNCKGVLRAVAQHAACASLRRQGLAAFQSAEDLTNLPVLALQQDLATVQALGLTHAERNGHHYFAGLDHLPPSEAAGAAASHADLYRTRGRKYALRIDAGCIAVDSLLCKGYGYACAIDFAARQQA